MFVLTLSQQISARVASAKAINQENAIITQSVLVTSYLVRTYSNK